MASRNYPRTARLTTARRVLARATAGACGLAALVAASCSSSEVPADYDVVLRGGTIYDGSGQPPRVADLAIEGDRIAAIGDLAAARGEIDLDVAGLAVTPGFINMLSWATTSLLVDGRSQGDLRQGVTLEVFGEGQSMGPLNESQKEQMLERQEWPFDIDWTTLGEYLESLERRGVATNVASFVGATTVRVHEVGFEDRAPTTGELERMQALVAQAMEEGALGVGSSLIYAPAFYASTDELVALCEVAARYGGRYISHLRSEGARLLEAVDELIEIARRAGIGAEIYHLKAAGRDNWPKLERVIARVEEARNEGLDVTADMYTYVAGATGLNASMPPWVQEGGMDRWIDRLRNPEVRARVEREMATPTDEWENLFLQAGGGEGVLLAGFRSPELKSWIGSTLAEVASARGQSPEATAIDLVIEDDSRVEAVYFLMSEENVERQIVLPWVTFGSDAASMSTEGVFLESSTHPRAYGNFARLLGRYVRERALIPFEEAVRRLTSLAAENLGIRERGRLEVGFFADVVVLDPETVLDHATFEAPHRYATGVEQVFVNGGHVLADGEPTGALTGRVVRGPGWLGWSANEESR